MASVFTPPQSETGYPNQYVLGIDLGTFKICTSVFRKGKVEIIPDGGHNTTPAQVAFTPRGRLIGNSAAKQAHLNPENTISHATHFLGKDINDDGIQDLLSILPFDVVSTRKKLYFKVQYQNQDVCITPQEVLAMLLDHVKRNAEKCLNSRIEAAVLVLPSTYDRYQRQLVISAASGAGLHVLHIVKGSMACAIGYHLDQSIRPQQKIMVVDIASRATDVTLFHVNTKDLRVISSVTDTSVGGEHFTNHLASFVLRHASDYIDPANLDDNLKMNRFWKECETAKRALSKNDYSDIEYGFLIGDIQLQYVLSPSWLDGISQALFQKVLLPIKAALHESSTHKSEVDEIIVVGASSRNSALLQMITAFFGRDLPNHVDPDHDAAHGASMYAAYLTGNWTGQTLQQPLNIPGILPRSLGIKSDSGYIKVLLEGSTLPCEGEIVVSTNANFSRDFQIPIYEGESEKAMSNRLLGTIKIPVAFRWNSIVQILLTFEVSAADEFSVRVMQMGNDESCTIDFPTQGTDCENEVARMTKKLDQFRKDNRPESLEHDAFGAPRQMKSSPRKLLLAESTLFTIRQKTEVVETTIEWVQSLPAKEEVHHFVDPVKLQPSSTVYTQVCQCAAFGMRTRHLLMLVYYYFKVLRRWRGQLMARYLAMLMFWCSPSKSKRIKGLLAVEK